MNKNIQGEKKQIKASMNPKFDQYLPRSDFIAIESSSDNLLRTIAIKLRPGGITQYRGNKSNCLSPRNKIPQETIPSEEMVIDTYARFGILSLFGKCMVLRVEETITQPIINKMIPTNKIPAQYSPGNPRIFVALKKTLRIPKIIEKNIIRIIKTRWTVRSIISSLFSLTSSI
jgi:hypothetical protein